MINNMIRFIKTFTVTILLGGTYLSNAQCPQPVVPVGDTNLVINGGFETSTISPSNTGVHFYVAPNCNCSSPGAYTIGGLSQSFNVGLIPNVTPHTGAYMLMIDNVMAPNATAWEQTITVEPNTVYFFSSWLTALSAVEKSEMIFQVEAGSVTSNLGDYFIPPNGPEWQQYFGTWNSGSNTSATIRLINTNPNASGGGGNDYALDDIVFSASCVGVDAGPVPNFDSDTISLCNWGGEVDLNTNVSNHADHTYTWYYEGGTVSASPSEPNILRDQSALGTYVSCLDSNGCVNSDTIEVVADLVIDFGDDADLCDPVSKLLNTNITIPDNFTISWLRDNVVIDEETGTSYLVVGPGTYRVEVLDDIGSSCDGSDEIIITSSVPEPFGAIICPAEGVDTAEISVVGSGAYKWWDAQTGGNEIGVGPSQSFTGLTGSVTYYVNDTTLVSSTAGLGDPSGLSGSGLDHRLDFNYMGFTANIDCNLDIVTAYFNNSGSATLRLRDLTTTTDVSFPVTISTAGGADVNVNLPLIQGHDYQLAITNPGGGAMMANWYNAPPAYFPATYDAVTMTSGGNSHPNLFDWQLSAPTSCLRVPVPIDEVCTDTPEECPVTIPNVFTPNGDGVNDTWEILDIGGCGKQQVTVYNRWGNEVYTSTEYTTPWDGTVNGKLLPYGTYYYVIVLGDNDQRQGNLIILK